MKDAQTPPTLPPGPPPLPILGNRLPLPAGNTLAFRRDPLRFLRTMQQYGRLATIHLGKVPVSKEIDT
jgi:hypothetical protein